nr:MAG TPA: hypothetical protein [Caudoviricetes sp.]
MFNYNKLSTICQINVDNLWIICYNKKKEGRLTL